MTRERPVRRSPGALDQRARRSIALLIAGQLGVTLALAAVLALVMAPAAGYSALVGGLIGVIPNYHFAGRLARRRPGASAVESLRRIYVGEFIKMAFTVALFVIAIRMLQVNFLMVVLGYFATVVVTWLAVALADLGEMPRGRPRRAQLRTE